MERARARRPARPEVRFDDCRASPARASRLTGLGRVIEAREPAEVSSALDELARAVRAGLWAGGFVTYEAAPAFDPAFEVATRGGPPSGSMPLLWFGLFERREGAPPLEPGDDTPADPGYRLSDWTPSIDRPAYEAAVERIRELIADGQTYQVNYTFKLQAAFEGDDFALYRDLCLAQRAADCAYVSTGRFRVLSASPELFFRVDGDRVTSRPMKGTSRRGRWVEEDREALAVLLASSKDRAENAMIVDLIRNDLGKVSTTGTVEVPRLFDAERYETVWQLTSTVTSRLPGGAEPMDVLRALFPSGSVTGAPKVRTMRIIADLEDSPRGV
ncbi:MAG TPA: chorismate-binding protein, partial [Actinomycetota bacterium]|nr:chorismate-binding protein [Actinomycetota bacterium]